METVPGERIVWSMVEAFRSMGNRRPLDFPSAGAASATDPIAALTSVATITGNQY